MRGRALPVAVRDFVRQHYRSAGAAWCAQETGLTVVQVWGLAARTGIAPHRGTQRHSEHRQHRSQTAGFPRARYDDTDLAAALKNWPATHPIEEQTE